MPGLLKPSAVCPVCSDALMWIVDNTSFERVRREYFHQKSSPHVRRRRRCVRVFDGYEELKAAARERKALEVPSRRRPGKVN
jgi:hypothetical protein